MQKKGAACPRRFPNLQARHVKNLDTTGNARAQWAARAPGQAGLCLLQKIEMASRSRPRGPLARWDPQRMRAQCLERRRIAVAKAGPASLAGRLSAAFKSKGAVERGREKAWLFDGRKTASRANPSVKLDLKLSVLEIVLTCRWVAARMKEIANRLGAERVQFKVDPNLARRGRVAACSKLQVPVCLFCNSGPCFLASMAHHKPFLFILSDCRLLRRMFRIFHG